MLSDLEVIFLAYYCRMTGWGITDEEMVKKIIRQDGDGCEDDKRLEKFLEFNAFFVKYYVGDEVEFEAIK